jgi:hypothetical protein
MEGEGETGEGRKREGWDMKVREGSIPQIKFYDYTALFTA